MLRIEQGNPPITLINRFLQFLDRVRSFGRSGSFGLGRLRGREKYRADYEVVARSILARIDFDSVIDVGCANGFLLIEFLRAGKRVRGIDLSPALAEVLPPDLLPHVETGDFSQATGRYDLVCCVEVAEHIRPERSEELVEKLIALAERRIYFSAAPPGQLGRGHINLRPHNDWINWFEARGWSLDRDSTSAMQHDLEHLSRTGWLGRNIMIFRPGDRD